MSEPEHVTVSPEQVVAILCRDPLGEALWRAAANAALAEAWRERYEKAISDTRSN
jgi:hypothetical protein